MSRRSTKIGNSASGGKAVVKKKERMFDENSAVYTVRHFAVKTDWHSRDCIKLDAILGQLVPT